MWMPSVGSLPLWLWQGTDDKDEDSEVQALGTPSCITWFGLHSPTKGYSYYHKAFFTAFSLYVLDSFPLLASGLGQAMALHSSCPMPCALSALVCVNISLIKILSMAQLERSISYLFGP